MKLICYPSRAEPPRIRPAPAEREWMSQTPERYAYRCLPIAAANSHGWEILAPEPCTIYWNGGDQRTDISIDAPSGEAFAASHFGSGIVTFQVGYLIRTEPQVNLWVTGPVNDPKDGIAPLSGVIETDWMPYSFTMNWRMTRSHHEVHFDAGEPFCFFFPLTRGTVASVEPELRDLACDPELAANYRRWSEGRRDFLKDLQVPGSASQEARWQRHYFRGVLPDGTAGTSTHEPKIRARPFSDHRGVSAGVTSPRR